MQRDKRVNDNWALISSQYIALKNKVPLYVCFQYLGEYKDSNTRHYDFLFKGLEETAQCLEENNIRFILLKGKVNDVIPEFIESKKIGTLVADFSPLKIYKKEFEEYWKKYRFHFSRLMHTT